MAPADDVTNFLKDYLADFLLTDSYAGYGKSIKELKEKHNKEIGEVFCNAHAYRYFEGEKNNSPSMEALNITQMMSSHFEGLTKCLTIADYFDVRLF